MKKILISLAAVVTVTALQAQTAYDALLYSKQNYQGTARSVAMGNAFTALGGDLGALGINPAASALYKHSELVFTPAFNIISSNTDYLNKEVNNSTGKIFVSNFGMVSSIPIKNSYGKSTRLNFSVAVNRVADYNNRYSVSGTTDSYSWLSSMAGYLYNLQGSSRIHAADMDITNNYNPFYDNPRIPWKFILAWNSSLLDTLSNGYDYVAATENITPTSFYIGGDLMYDFYRETTGGNDEIIFNLGGNFENRFFYGFNLGINTLKYTDFQEYSEAAVNPNDFDTQFSSFTHTYNQNTVGIGVNLKAGFIFVPSKSFRIGGSIATPTWYSMTDEWSESIRSYFDDGYYVSLDSPLGTYDYNMRTPWKVNMGAAYILGESAVFSLDYEGTDYTSIKLSSSDRTAFDYDNGVIADEFKFTHNLRAGMEIKPTPNFAIRAGYNYYQNPEKNYGKDRHIGSVGFGVKGNGGFFADFALQGSFNDESFSLSPVYDTSAPTGTLKTTRVKAFVTLGLKF